MSSSDRCDALLRSLPWRVNALTLLVAFVLLQAVRIARAQGECYKDCCDQGPSPILVDTNGRGFHLTSASDGVVFDIWADGHPIKLAWTVGDSGNAFLALDRNHNGKIDSGKELFGNVTEQPPCPDGATSCLNGYRALAEFDRPENGGNGDGIIDSRDAVYSKLLLWIDANHDGISQPEELHTLPELGVYSIGLHYRDDRHFFDQYGNWFHYQAALNPDARDGVSKDGRLTYDVFFQTPLTKNHTESHSVAFPARGAYALPGASESQVVPKLHLAPSPEGRVSLTRFRPDQFPAFGEIFDLSPGHLRVRSVSFVLSNQTDKAIIGVAFRWILSDRTGSWVPYTLRTHSFLSPNPLPLAPPGKRLLVTPGSFFPEGVVSGQGGIVGSVPSEKVIRLFDGASDVNVEIDSIIFEDGEVVGPDQLHLARDIRARKSAALLVLKQVRAAESRNESASEVLQRLRAGPITDEAGRQASQLAGELIRARSLSQGLKSLENIQVLPLLFRRDGNPL